MDIYEKNLLCLVMSFNKKINENLLKNPGSFLKKILISLLLIALEQHTMHHIKNTLTLISYKA